MLGGEPSGHGWLGIENPNVAVEKAISKWRLFMLIPFAASNFILWFSLWLTVRLSEVAPLFFLDFIPIESLANILAGSVPGIMIGRAYDILITEVSNSLQKPITPPIFAAASLFIVVQVILFALKIPIDSLIHDQLIPFSICLFLVLYVFGMIEAWEFLSSQPVQSFKLFFAAIGGGLIAMGVFLTPLYINLRFVNYYNAGFAACVAGWAAGLLSRELKQISKKRESVEVKAAHELVKSLIEREVPVITAVVFVYFIFRVSGVNPILFSMVVATASAIIGKLIANTISID